MVTWNWLDWTLTLIVLVSVIVAAMKGFMRELISLAALVLGLAIAAVGYERVAPWFDDLTRSHQVALAAGFLTLFVGTLIVGALLSAFARRLVKKAGLQSYDRFLGAVFGLIRGVVIDCVLLMALVAFAIKPDAVQQSELAPYVATGARVIALAMPADLRSQFRSGFETFRETLIRQDSKATKDSHHD